MQYRTLVATKRDRVVGVVGIGLAHYYERTGSHARILVLSVLKENAAPASEANSSAQPKTGHVPRR